MKYTFLSFVFLILVVSQTTVVNGQDNQLQPCTADQVQSAIDEFKTVHDQVTSEMTLSSDRFTWDEYFLYFYDLRIEWLTEKAPALPNCQEIQNTSSAMVDLIDELLITTGLANTGLLELERKNTDVALEFQKRITNIDSARLDKALEEFNTLYAGLGEPTILEASTPITTMSATASSATLLFTDQFSDPDIVGRFEVSCPKDLFPVFYPIVTDNRPDEAIEFLASIEVIDMGDLSYGDVQNIFRDNDRRYPHILVGNISYDDVNTTNEFQEKYRRHELVFIPLSGGEFYRIEHDQADYSYIWQKVSAAQVEELFKILNAPKCLEGLEPYSS
jgi:hypothetical protein